MEIENNIETKDGENIFQLRLIKSEGIGLATTKRGKNYLILDSSDYWYDIIQNGYPKIKKCSCKNDWFKLKFKYYYREHYNDVENIEIKTICENCGKMLIVLNIDIKYSPTEHLINNPLVYCEKPNIKYDSKIIMKVLSKIDFHNILGYLSEIGFNIYCWYWNGNNKKREFKMLSKSEIKQPSDFLKIYITQNIINIDDFALTTNELGVYIQENSWRKNEIIEIGNVYIVGHGTNYVFEYGTQFIGNTGKVENKSKEFTEKITKFEKWFGEEYEK